jgi:hypothetical protein
VWHDPIVEEIHCIRREHVKKFSGDLHAICEDLRNKQALSGHKIVSRPARPPVIHHVARQGT